MAKNERKLTPAEQKRKEQFALVCEEMERQGYRKTDLTIGVVKANLLALIVILPFAVLSGAVVLSRVSFRSMAESMSPFDFLLFLLVMLLSYRSSRRHPWTYMGSFCRKSLESHSLRRDLECAYALLHLCAADEARAVYSRRGHADARAWYRPDGRRGSDRDFLGLHSGDDRHDLRRRRGFCHYTQNRGLHRQRGKEAVYYDHPYECGVVVFEKDCSNNAKAPVLRHGRFCVENPSSFKRFCNSEAEAAQVFDILSRQL